LSLQDVVEPLSQFQVDGVRSKARFVDQVLATIDILIECRLNYCHSRSTKR
jgi:hypothetical protein